MFFFSVWLYPKPCTPQVQTWTLFHHETSWVQIDYNYPLKTLVIGVIHRLSPKNGTPPCIWAFPKMVVPPIVHFSLGFSMKETTQLLKYFPFQPTHSLEVHFQVPVVTFPEPPHFSGFRRTSYNIALPLGQCWVTTNGLGQWQGIFKVMLVVTWPKYFGKIIENCNQKEP